METKTTEQKEPKRVSKFWEACQRLKGNLSITDPMLFL